MLAFLTVFVLVLLFTYLEIVPIFLGAVLLLIFPAHVIFFILLGIEEEVIAGGHSADVVSPLVRVGSEFFVTTVAGLRLPLLVILLATCLVLFRHRRGFALKPMLLVLSLVVWSVALALFQGYDLNGAVGAATPWILVMCGFVVGSYVATNEAISSHVVLVAAFTMLVKATVGIFVFLRGDAIPDPTGLAAVVYYDSTLSYLAMTFLVAWVYNASREHPSVILMASSLLVIFVAMRRNVIAATIWALAAIALIKGDFQTVMKVSLRSLLAIGVVFVLLPDTMMRVASGIERSVIAFTTGEGDSSTSGHLNDIDVGLRVIMQDPLWGLGVFPPPQAGLVVGSSANLYIHNEFLQTWARFGLGGVMLLAALLSLGIVYGCRVFRSEGTGLLRSASAVFFIAIPIPLMFFPHLSTLVRFGFFTGFFLAIVSTQVARYGENKDVLQLHAESRLDVDANSRTSAST